MMLITSSISGWFHAERRIADIFSRRSSWFFAPNFAISKFSRAKALTTRTPLRLSCMTVPSSPFSFCTFIHNGRKRRPTCRDRKMRIGTLMRVTSARYASRRNRITVIAAKVTIVSSERNKPSVIKFRTASISTVRRDISCPVSDSSWKAKLSFCR